MSTTFEPQPIFNQFIDSVSQMMSLTDVKNSIKKWQEGSRKSKSFLLNAFNAKPNKKSIEEVQAYLNENFIELCAIHTVDEYSSDKKESGSIYLVNKKNHDFFVLSYVPNPHNKKEVLAFNMTYYPTINKYLEQVLTKIQMDKMDTKPIKKMSEKTHEQLLTLVDLLNIRYEKFLLESQTQSNINQKQKAKI